MLADHVTYAPVTIESKAYATEEAKPVLLAQFLPRFPEILVKLASMQKGTKPLEVTCGALKV